MTCQTTIDTIKKYLKNQFHLPGEQIEIMLPSFISTLKDHMRNLELAVEDENFDVLGKAGHTIKGAFLNLGLKECAEIALKIEEKGKIGDHSTNFRALLEDLRLKIGPVLG